MYTYIHIRPTFPRLQMSKLLFMISVLMVIFYDHKRKNIVFIITHLIRVGGKTKRKKC